MVPLQNVGLEVQVIALVDRLEDGASLFKMLFFERQALG